MIVILHNIRSLHNVGSIFRTADAAGVSPHTKRALALKAQKKKNADARYGVGVYLCGITPSPVDEFGKLKPQFAKVALGAEKYIKWEKVKSTSALVDRLKSEGYKILAVEQSRKSIPYHKVRVRPKDKVALVLGSEIKGLPVTILSRVDKILEIPMAGRKESLNVAVAFGIVAFGLKYR
ncbi:MAG: TrmH family RNA methyltransferase [Candidatus Colwellbacteria bacterium]|nr:TrmH family RNA methyltransferase [Candidatus Colwellbacteria bacterium]